MFATTDETVHGRLVQRQYVFLSLGMTCLHFFRPVDVKCALKSRQIHSQCYEIASLWTIATVVRTFAIMRYLQDPAFAILPYRKSSAINNTKVSNQPTTHYQFTPVHMPTSDYTYSLSIHHQHQHQHHPRPPPPVALPPLLILQSNPCRIQMFNTQNHPRPIPRLLHRLCLFCKAIHAGFK